MSIGYDRAMNLAVNLVVLAALAVAVASLVVAMQRLRRAVMELHMNLFRIQERVGLLEDEDPRLAGRSTPPPRRSGHG
jgi:hypothetical protein